MSHEQSESDRPSTSTESSHGSARPSTGTRGSVMRGFHGTWRLLGPSLVVGLVAPYIFPALRRAVRPAAKGVIKSALNLSESVKEGAAGAREQLSDLMAEVRAEREQDAASSTPDPSA
jgi:hypothetical protein